MRCACVSAPVSPPAGEGPAGEAPLRPFDEVVQLLWRKAVGETPFCKDLPRLCRRLVIRNSRIPEEKTWADSGQSTVDAIADIFLYVMRELEPEHYQAVREAVLRTSSAQRQCQDLEGVVALLVEAVGGEQESAAVRVLKLINQNVILAAVEHLHHSVCKGLLTKDVRSKDGWRVVLDLEPSRIQLHHIRREQSVDGLGGSSAADHFEFEFEVTCTFELATASLATATLRIIRLDVADTMSEEKKSHLKSRLLGDVIIG